MDLLETFLEGSDRGDLTPDQEKDYLIELEARGVYRETVWEADCWCCRMMALEAARSKFH